MTDEIKADVKKKLTHLLRKHIRHGVARYCPFSCAGLVKLQELDKKTYDDIREYFYWPTFTERGYTNDDGKAACHRAERKHTWALRDHVAAKAAKAEKASSVKLPARQAGPPIDEDDDDYDPYDDDDDDDEDERRNDAAHLVYNDMLSRR